MNYLNLLADVSIVVSGFMVGLYLGWAISVLPGLSLLPDADYLNTFQPDLLSLIPYENPW